MNTRTVLTADDARQLLDERRDGYVKVAITDMDGVMRGKYMSRDKFLAAFDDGFGFCDVVLGWDVADQLYDKCEYTGWHTAYPDARVRIVADTSRELSMEDGMLFFLCEFAGPAEAICPRGTLKRVLARAHDMGFSVTAAAEFETFLFDETPWSVRDKGYADLKGLTPGHFGYSVLRSSVHSELYRAVLDMCREMDMALEGLHTETGPGVMEAAIAHDDALAAADKASLYKTFLKVLCQRREIMATFMAKWSNDWPGSSGHLHVSLKDMDGVPVFYAEDASDNMSDVMRWFIGGQQRLMPEWLAMVAPTVNSYTRLVPGFWAPTHASWGHENRTTALRTIGNSAKSRRVEYRVAAADINPYVALAAAIGSGLWGIENKIEPTAPVKGNAYEAELGDDLALPKSLGDAAERLAGSEAAREIFGDAFLDHYVQSRQWEARQAPSGEDQSKVTTWQLDRYFEII